MGHNLPKFDSRKGFKLKIYLKNSLKAGRDRITPVIQSHIVVSWLVLIVPEVLSKQKKRPASGFRDDDVLTWEVAAAAIQNSPVGANREALARP